MSPYPVQTEDLLSHGRREEELQGVLPGNLFWVFSQEERYAGLSKRVSQESEQVGVLVCWGKLWKLLTTNCCLQVREENRSKGP